MRSSDVFAEINEWWRANQSRGVASLLLGYTVGKAQRLLASVDASIGPIFAHGAILSACRAYRECGVKLPELGNCMTVDSKYDWSRSLILAPPSALGTTWLRRFGNVSTGMLRDGCECAVFGDGAWSIVALFCRIMSTGRIC